MSPIMNGSDLFYVNPLRRGDHTQLIDIMFVWHFISTIVMYSMYIVWLLRDVLFDMIALIYRPLDTTRQMTQSRVHAIKVIC